MEFIYFCCFLAFWIACASIVNIAKAIANRNKPVTFVPGDIRHRLERIENWAENDLPFMYAFKPEDNG